MCFRYFAVSQASTSLHFAPEFAIFGFSFTTQAFIYAHCQKVFGTEFYDFCLFIPSFQMIHLLQTNAPFGVLIILFFNYLLKNCIRNYSIKVI